MPAVEILENLFFIERGFLNANHFAYRAEKPILIDTGHLNNFAETRHLLNQVGVRLADVSLIINTHTHCDHIGGNHKIQQRSGCDIALHWIGKHFIDNRDDWATWWRYFGQAAEFFKATHALNDGDVIAVGPYEFEVIHTPGHASDGIALYHRQEKILLSSDALWPKDMGVMVLRVEGSRALFQMHASLDRLSRLDIKIAYPGHGPPFTDFSAAIERARQRLNSFINDRERLGNDLMKKMLVYTLLEHTSISEDGFFPMLMASNWFKENVDFHFDVGYEAKYRETLDGLCQRGIIERKDGRLFTTVKP